jgi:hypothetical protein
VALRGKLPPGAAARKIAATKVLADLLERVTFLEAMPDANPAFEAERERAAAAVERWLLMALQTVMTVASLASVSGAADNAGTQQEAGEWQC